MLIIAAKVSRDRARGRRNNCRHTLRFRSPFHALPIRLPSLPSPPNPPRPGCVRPAGAEPAVPRRFAPDPNSPSPALNHPPLDLPPRTGRISNADGPFHADIGVRNGVIVEIAPKLAASTRDVDAAGRWVLPGGIDSHCHIEQISGMGVMCADDFHSGTVSAAFGGTTTILSFAAQ